MRVNHVVLLHFLKRTLLRTPVALTVLAIAVAAHAGFTTLRWSDGSPQPSPVAGFQVYAGPNSRSYDTVIDVGIPTADGGGVFSIEVEIPDEAVTYLAVTAYDVLGRESDFSNEKIAAAGVDLDGDGMADLADNCLGLANPNRWTAISTASGMPATRTSTTTGSWADATSSCFAAPSGSLWEIPATSPPRTATVTTPST